MAHIKESKEAKERERFRNRARQTVSSRAAFQDFKDAKHLRPVKGGQPVPKKRQVPKKKRSR